MSIVIDGTCYDRGLNALRAYLEECVHEALQEAADADAPTA